MAALSFFWHDYETFGRLPRRDRPAQFAGLRTDAELRQTDEAVTWYCRPSPDQLPDPEAVLLTGITPQQALQRGLPETEFADRIEAELARPGTVGVGYNSIRFDDEVTRHLFWRNLLDPYSREWRDGCGRWDLLDVVRCCWALRPQGLEWPLHASGPHQGRPSFRLEDLTAANGVAHEAAHDALSDVRATVALARRVRERQPRLWEHCLKLRHKDAVWQEIGRQRPFVHVSGRYAVERGCLAVVWPLAPHPTNRNELIVWDLAHDPSALQELSPEAVRQRLFTPAASLPEGQARLPIKTIHVNRAPVVIGALGVLGPAAARWGIDLDAAQRHAERAQALQPALEPLWEPVFRRPEAAPADIDEDLYGGFLTPADRRALQRLRSLPAATLAGGGALPAFDDGRLEELVFRWRARNFPDTLDAADAERWLALRRARLLDGEAGHTTLAAFRRQLQALEEAWLGHADARSRSLLAALAAHADAIDPAATPAAGDAAAGLARGTRA